MIFLILLEKYLNKSILNNKEIIYFEYFKFIKLMKKYFNMSNFKL